MSEQCLIGGLRVQIQGGRLCLDAIPRPYPHVAVVVLSAGAPYSDLEIAAQIARSSAGMPIIAVAHEVTSELAVRSMRAGCVDLLQWPYTNEALGDAIQRALSRRTWGDSAPEGTGTEREPDDAVNIFEGISVGMAKARAAIRRAASSLSTVLVTGETGTGKELVSELVHRLSVNADQPLIRLNCAAIPDTLLESELFGHERGAFTGAGQKTIGKLQLAGTGTLLLDEVGDMSPLAQAKILRTIESREAYRVGGSLPFQVRCRFVAATNSDLERDVLSGRFRKDLYYRLNVARIRLSPLRERTEDVPSLCQRFIREFNTRFGTDVTRVEPRVTQALMRHAWPGNVRELRNVLEASYLNRPSSCLEWRHLPDWFTELVDPAPDSADDERSRIADALRLAGGNKSLAAARLGVSRMTLYRKMERLQLS